MGGSDSISFGAEDETLHPERIAQFEILEQLGSGAMGLVYRALDPMLKREVALKLIRPELTEDPHTRKRFIRECRVAASINHPGIATIYEAGETQDGQFYFASELISGESLQKRVERGPLSVDEVVAIGIQLGEALAAAHERGIVHRDIKPANLMVQADGRLKVLDFGLARLTGRGAGDADSMQTVTQTRFGTVVGTPAYMSPEQATGDRVDARTDIFACGSVLYAAVSGKEAFLSGSVPETLRRILTQDPAPLESIDPSIPRALRSVIVKAMAKDPGQRFATAAELADALRTGRVEPAPAREPARPRRRARNVLLGSALAVLLVAAAVVAVRLSSRPSLAFATRDKLLITSVDNQTDDSAFDLALRTALEADIQQSRFVAVFDQSRAAETLRLMRRDPATRIDEALGRDICRFAGVRAMLLPRVLAVGQAYELQAILIDPVTGRHVDRIRVTALGREEVLLRAIDELTRRLRGRLGETIESIEKTDEPVVQVATSSWEALEYATLGQSKWNEQKYRDSAAMFELALEKDPAFASAKASLGLLLIQFLGDAERGRLLLREALEDAEELPEWERLMIRALNRQFVDQDADGALEEYALISELYPDRMEPYNNRGRILNALGRYDEAVEMFERSAALHRINGVPLSNLYWVHLAGRRDPAAAEAAARRLVELSPSHADYRNLLAWSLVAQTRFEEALPEMRRVLADEPRHRFALPNMAHVLYLTGSPEEAIPLYRRYLEHLADNPVQVGVRRDLALALADAGRPREATELLEAEIDRLIGDGTKPLAAADAGLVAQLLAAAGRGEEARDRLAGVVERGADDADARMGLAIAYALLDDPDEALQQMRRSFQLGYRDRYFPLVLPPFRRLHDDPRFYELLGVAGAGDSP